MPKITKEFWSNITDTRKWCPLPRGYPNTCDKDCALFCDGKCALLVIAETVHESIEDGRTPIDALHSLKTICFILADYYGKDDSIDVAIAIAASPFRLNGSEPISDVLARIKTNYV